MTSKEAIQYVKHIRGMLNDHFEFKMEGIDHIEITVTAENDYLYKVVLQKLTNDGRETFHYGQFVKFNRDQKEWMYFEI